MLCYFHSLKLISLQFWIFLLNSMKVSAKQLFFHLDMTCWSDYKYNNCIISSTLRFNLCNRCAVWKTALLTTNLFRRNLNICFYQSNWIWCIRDFEHSLRIFKLKTFCPLKYYWLWSIDIILQPYMSNHKITLLQVLCYFHAPEMITLQFWIFLLYSS